MPPWKPEPGFGEFHGERRLTGAEIAVFAKWVEAGMPAGDAIDAAAPPPGSRGWRLGEPDVVLRLPEYVLRADGPDVFRNFVVAMPQISRRFVRAWQFRPGTSAVHHANIRIDPTAASRRLDDNDPSAGYEGVILRSADFPEGHFLGWTPGQVPAQLTDAGAWPIQPGHDFVVQLHMRPTGKPERVAPLVGLYLGNTPPSSSRLMIRLGRQNLRVPANATDHRVIDSLRLPVAVDVHAIQAHAHYRARSVHAWAALPDGTRRELLRINDWDPAWQERYEYRAPVTLPAQTTITTEYVFDNSAANPRNPDRPPRLAEWGWRTIDEMGDVWLQVSTTSPADREALRARVQQHMLNEDAVGTEQLVAREPGRVDLRNDAAAIYMALQRYDHALRHFREARRLRPSAIAAFNVGVALEATAQHEAAERAYAEAANLDPAYSAAHNNLGTMLLRRGKADGAHAAFARAVASNPDNAEARANLAVTSIARGDYDAASMHAMAAVRLRPDNAFACRLSTALAAASSREDIAIVKNLAAVCLK
jgi:tetratricopeptide (TPR) repeat protein